MSWPYRKPRFDAVLQGSNTECALASIVMVMAAAGRHVSMTELRERWPAGARATSLSTIIRILDAYGAVARPMATSLSGLQRLRVPAILHWDFNHFVVLERAHAKHMCIVDPAVGRRRLTLDAMSRHFTGVALEVDPAAVLPNTRDAKQSAISALLPQSKLYRGALIGTVALSLATNATILSLPLFLKTGLETLLPSENRHKLTLVALLFVMGCFGHYALQVVRGMAASSLRSALSRSMAGGLFQSLVGARFSFFESRAANSLASQYQAVQTIVSIFTEQALLSTIDLLFIVTGVAILSTSSPSTGLLVAVGLAIYLAVQMFAVGDLRSRLTESLQAELNEQGYVFETIENISAVKLYSGRAERLSTWHNIHSDTILAQRSLWRSQDRSLAKQELVANVIWVLAVLLLLHAGLDGHLSIGSIAACASWTGFILGRAREVARGVVAGSAIQAHLARVEDIVTAPIDQAPSSGRGIDPTSGPAVSAIAAERISYRYGEALPWILKDASFHVERGEFVGIVGPSGVGKSTLIKLLTGLLECERGDISAAGAPTTSAAIEAIRRSAGVVLQTDTLLTGSLRDNVTFFDVDPCNETLDQCARLACISELVSRTPLGWDAVVGRRGAGFSTGQVQRLVLARALYRRPSLLLLDEFTSSLDESLEAEILANLKTLDVAVLAVAHRPQVINACSRLYRLDGGRLCAG